MSDDGAAPAQPGSSEPPPAKPKASGAAIGCGTVLALIIVGGIVSCVASLNSGGSSNDHGVDRIEAQLACQDFVKEKLKAPATAKFSGQQTNVAGVNQWTVTGLVDAENSFGAMLRSNWTCSIRLDGDTWRATTTID